MSLQHPLGCIKPSFNHPSGAVVFPPFTPRVRCSLCVRLGAVDPPGGPHICVGGFLQDTPQQTAFIICLLNIFSIQFSHGVKGFDVIHVIIK